MSCSSKCHFDTLRPLTTNITTTSPGKSSYSPRPTTSALRSARASSARTPRRPGSGYLHLVLSAVAHHAQFAVARRGRQRTGHGALMAFQNAKQPAHDRRGGPDHLERPGERRRSGPGRREFVQLRERQRDRSRDPHLYVAGVRPSHAREHGISVSPTALGTYPVYLRYHEPDMSGTNPDARTTRTRVSRGSPTSTW